jgi:predicted HTH transcriptional regulator
VKRLSEKVESEKLLTQHLPKLSAELLALAREQGRITTQLAEQKTGANRATIRSHLIKLVKDGRLVQHGAGRGTWYVVAGP